MSAAIDTGAKLDTIVAAVKAAGIDRIAVKHAFDVNKVNLAGADVSKYSDDKSKQALKVFDDTIFAYTPPADNTSKSSDKTGDNKTFNAFTYQVNNSGGSTPSTKTASPIL